MIPLNDLAFIAHVEKSLKIEKDNQLKWDKRYLILAKHVASWSKDPRKKCGAVVVGDRQVLGIGYNGFPKGIQDTDKRLLDKSLKLQIVVHAEVNAILAANNAGDTMYVYPQLPCGQCMGLIIQAGIKRVVTGPLNTESNWNQGLVLEVAEEGGIDVCIIDILR